MKPEVIALEPVEVTPGGFWWGTYATAAAPDLTKTAWSVIDADSKFIVDHGLFGAGAAGDPRWPTHRVRSGLVIGAVQSGKTASMFGVMAGALDRGVDMIVVLAGTRIALWQQTFERFQKQLEPADLSPFQLRKRRFLRPDASAIADANPGQLYSLPVAQLKVALSQRRPIITFAMKHPSHLQALSKHIRIDLVPLLDRPFHLVVLDDEADDGSVLDAVAEADEDPILGNLKQTPRAIHSLWHGSDGATASPHMHATYVAYTATPQASVLQEAHNPLAPRDFVMALRSPFDSGALSPRESTYFEPTRLPNYYTGGAAFYERGASARLCQVVESDDPETIPDAVRAYLIAGAIRLARRPEGIGPASAQSTRFVSKSDVARVGKPHTMLIHPSGVIDDHFAAGERLLTWAGMSPESAEIEIRSKDARLPSSLCSDVQAFEDLWRRWLDEYIASAQSLAQEFDLATTPAFPEWGTVRQLLTTEIIPGTRIAIINSREDAEDRPLFDASIDADGAWRTPKDLATIFISGNVMSRGLTLDGLTTTLFVRSSNTPFADTQMQMQRWFGYRGRDLELCRVMLPPDQLSLFRRYHSADDALRRFVVRAMNESSEGAPNPTILQGSNFLATGKIANLRQTPLAPGPSSMIRFTNRDQAIDPNVGHAADLFANYSSIDVTVGGTTRGRILSEPLTLIAAADWLDGLRYANYQPGRAGRTARYWQQLEAVAGSIPTALSPLYRAPEPTAGHPPDDARTPCPYAVAAYLRLWSLGLTHRMPGLVATDDPDLPWPMVDLARKTSGQPRFHVGIKFGKAHPVTQGPLTSLEFAIRPMQREFDGSTEWMRDGWGSGNPTAKPGSYLGDEYFDYHATRQRPGASQTWRPVGSDGLLLVHLLDRGGSLAPTLALGACVPIGGPDQFPVLTAPTASDEVLT